jgi:predicted 3-demethylubiquinone-9 3-methyltransferase (glyoxalase superfamily)
MATLSKISPCLWFDDQAEEAAAFYTKVFDSSQILRTLHYTDAGPRPAGTVLLVDFELEGIQFTALNGGPEFTFDEAVSFQVLCQDQAEVDRYWDALVDGGEEAPCGWLKDRFGLSWQVVPMALYDLLEDGDPVRIERAMAAVLATFGKLDIAAIERAADGRD